MASGQVSRQKATQRRKKYWRSLTVTIDQYNRVTEKAREMGHPRIDIINYLIDYFLDQVTEVNLNASSLRGRL